MFSWNEDLSVWQNILAITIGIIIALAVAFGVMCLNSWLIMLLWNAILPSVFGWTALTFWQTFGIYLIIWLLCGGIGKFFPKKQKDD